MSDAVIVAGGKRVRLNVLDQSPVPEGLTPGQAIANSIDLAKHVERLGYHRYWMSEHHAMDLLACTAPEVLLARIGAETSRIRIGSGGIMLPHYSAYKVAEVFRTLYALYPGRIDLGIGRAPGGGPLEAHALRRERRQRPADDFADQIGELLSFLNCDFPAEHPFSQLTVSPEMPGGPEVWLLGSSLWSAETAAQFGLPYAFAHFFSPVHTRTAMEHYAESFRASKPAAAPRKSVAVGVLCAGTEEEAELLMASPRLLMRRIRSGDRRPVPRPEDALRELQRQGPVLMEEGEWPRYFYGTPERVQAQLAAFAGALDLDEVIAVTIVHDHAARLRSYELLAHAGDAAQSREVPRLATAH
ncbi:MAG TPA: LLM class flavin-dependent oxidoreductase [Acidobacteriaceae bacterium]